MLLNRANIMLPAFVKLSIFAKANIMPMKCTRGAQVATLVADQFARNRAPFFKFD